MTSAEGPLDGVRVLDLTQLLPGPYATMMLADMGADVIKVERPGSGEAGRQTAPFVDGVSTRHLILNRNKRSIELDLKSEAGRAAFLRLAATADVVVEGFRPDVMKRLGLGYEELSRSFPRIVYCSIGGYAHDSTLAGHAGHDLNYLSTTAVLSLSGGRGHGPTLPPVQIADLAGGAFPAALAIVAALYNRLSSGTGDHISVSIADGAFLLQVEAVAEVSGGRQPRAGATRLTGRYASYNVYTAADGVHYALAAWEEKFWVAFCELVERPDLVTCGALEGDEGREAIEKVEALFRSHDSGYWDHLLAGSDVCCTRIRDWDDVAQDDEFFDRGLLSRQQSSDGANHLQLGFPVSLEKTPSRLYRTAPKLGEHTDEVLAEIGLSETEIQVLERGRPPAGSFPRHSGR